MDEKTQHTKAVGYKPKRSPAKPFIALIVLVLVCGLSFWGGVAYEKGHVKTTAASTASTVGFGGFGSGQGGGRFSGQRPVRGQVTAVSSSSISVTDSTTGTSSTFSITSSTTITDNGQTVAASDIQTGDTVFIIVTSSGSTTASRILVNPSVGGGQAGQGSSTAPTTSTD